MTLLIFYFLIKIKVNLLFAMNLSIKNTVKTIALTLVFCLNVTVANVYAANDIDCTKSVNGTVRCVNSSGDFVDVNSKNSGASLKQSKDNKRALSRDSIKSSSKGKTAIKIINGQSVVCTTDERNIESCK